MYVYLQLSSTCLLTSSSAGKTWLIGARNVCNTNRFSYCNITLYHFLDRQTCYTWLYLSLPTLCTRLFIVLFFEKVSTQKQLFVSIKNKGDILDIIKS